MAHDVIGRSQELDALDGFLSALEGGPSGCVLDGAPGVGKTTLWLAGVEAARERDYRVLTTRPAEAEARFAFAGLGDLLDSELEELLETLPAPQADALRVALLLERPGVTPPDERTVAVAVLGSLRLLATERPLVLAVDDLQWLDSTSALVLSFAWRRIRDERVGLLVARRSGEPVLSAPRGGGDGSARRPAAEPRRGAWPASVADRSRSPPPDAAANLRRGGRQRVLRARAGARASAARSDSGPGRGAARAR